ncbi:MAG TPA: hypothetical protein VGH38_36235 [Bryobacteraceae bacterium]
MIDSRRLIPFACLLVTATIALAQVPAQAPAPPAAPVARPPRPAAPAPPAMIDADAQPAPRPAAAPRAPMPDPADVDQWREMARELAEDARDQVMRTPLPPLPQIDQEQVREMAEQARQMAEDARDQVMRAPIAIDRERVREMAEEAREKALADRDLMRGFAATPAPAPAPRAFSYGDGVGVGIGRGFGGTPLMAQSRVMVGRSGQSDDRLYDSGQRALADHKYEEALELFNQVASHAGPRADAAWYYKAYTLNKLNRSNEAQAAIAELRKSYASSRWLDDAKVLELEVKQRAGRPVSPEAESDEELKLIAISSIMQSDPDRAIPLLENILKSSQPPKVKDRALIVLAQSSAPRAQQVIEQIARGGANPDLQLKAINYLSQRRKQGTTNPNLLPEIYGATSDLNVKRAILNAWSSYRDKEHLAQVAKTEKSPELRRDAFQALGNNNPGQPELWQVYQSETSPETKQEILRCMYQDGNTEKLADVVRKETDAKTRRVAIEVLASQRGGATGDVLVSVYGSEQDPQVKQLIIDHLSNERNVKYLVDLARAEKDSKMKLRIVDRLSNMHSKVASDYLMEILSK